MKTHNPLKITVPLLLFSTLAVGEAASQETPVFWGDTLATSTDVTAPQFALNRPDGFLCHFSGAVPTAIYTDFGLGDVSVLDRTNLAALLGISPAVLAEADFITFEYNGSAGLAFESSTWTFDDGVTSLTLSHDFDNPSGSYPILAIDGIDNNAYANFFGFTNPWGSNGDCQALLFDLDGLDVQSPSFNLTLQAQGNSTSSPDIDALGLIVDRPLILSASPSEVLAGTPLEFVTQRGSVGDFALLVVLDVNGSPNFLPIASGVFGSDCRWSFGIPAVPGGLTGLSVTFGTYGIAKSSGSLALTNLQRISFL